MKRRHTLKRHMPNRRLSAGIAAALIAISVVPAAAQTPAPAQLPARVPLPAQPRLPLQPPTPTVLTPPSTLVPATAPGAVAAPGTAAANGIAARTLTIDQALAIALDRNTSVALAREKIIKSNELINEANAGGLPTVRVDLVDTYSGNKAFGTSNGGSNATGTLPGGGTIPVITDTGGGNAAGVTSSGGGGTATGAGATSTGTTTSTTATSTGATTTNTIPTNTTTSTDGTGGTGIGTTTGVGTGTTGTGTTSTGTFGTTGPTTQLRQRQSDLPPQSSLPPMIQQFAAANSPAGSTAKLPRADTTGTGTGTGQLPGNGSLNTSSTGHNNNYSGLVSVTQGIDIFNLVPAAQQVESLTRDFYLTDLERVLNETALSVKDQYFNVLRDQEQVIVDQEQVNADQESVRVTQAQVTAGAVAQFDLLTAQTTLANAQQVLSSAQDTLTLAQVNLDNLLGLNADTPLTLQVPALPPLNQAFDKNQLTQIADAQRPELHQATQNIVIAQRLVKLAGTGLLPSLSLVGSGNYAEYATNGNSHGTVSISAVLGIPLYDGGTTRAKIKEAQSDLRSQQITQGQLQENVAVEVRQALANITDAQTRAGSATLGAQQGAEAYRLADVRYKNGIGTILDVVNAQAQLAQARSNLVNAQYDYQTSLAQLTRAIGSR